MIRLTSSKTLKVLFYILYALNFSQTQVQKKTGVSFGRINKIINWLITKGIVVKQDTLYRLTAPNYLVEILSVQCNLSQNQIFHVNLQKSELIKLIKKNNGIFCLYSALELYDSNYVSDDIHIYYNESIINNLNLLPRGDTKVFVYDLPFKDINIDKFKTDIIQTILDLQIIRKSELLDNLKLKQWKTLQ
jgi:hypothetical protein